jgi:hypothetical protein
MFPRTWGRHTSLPLHAFDILNFHWTSSHGSVNFDHLNVLLAADVKRS